MRATYWMLAGIGLLTAVAIFVLATPGATAWYTGVQCPASGDWSVSSDTMYYDETLVVNGNLYVTTNLTLTNMVVNLNVASAGDGGRTLNVASGCSLTVYRSTITSNNGAYHYRFTVYGSMWINQSTISEMWGNTASWAGGIQIYSSNVWIGNSTIYNGKTGGIYIDSCSPWIYNNNIYSNGGSGTSTYAYGIYAKGTSSTAITISTNQIYNNQYQSGSNYYGYGIRSEYMNSNDAIYNNNIYSNGHTAGFGYRYGYQLYLYYSTPTITNNQLSNGQYQLYCSYSNPPTINGGSITTYAYSYVTAYGVYAQYSGLSFANVSFKTTSMNRNLYGAYGTSYSPMNFTDCTFDYRLYGSYTIYGVYASSYSPVRMVRCNMYQDAYSTIYAVYASSYSNIDIVDSTFSNNQGYYYGIYGTSYCKLNVTGTTMSSQNAYYSYMMRTNSYSPVNVERSNIQIWYNYYDARIIESYSSSPVYMNNTALTMYSCNQYQSAYQMWAMRTYSSSSMTVCNVTADFQYNNGYYWYAFYSQNAKLIVNDTTITDTPGNIFYGFYEFYSGSGETVVTNTKVRMDVQLSYQWGSVYVSQTYSGGKSTFDRFTLTGSTSGYFYGLYQDSGTVFVNNSNIKFVCSGYGAYMTMIYNSKMTFLNTNFDIESQGVQYGAILQSYAWSGSQNCLVDNCTFLLRTSNSPGANTGMAVFQELQQMDVLIRNSTVTTVNTDGVAGVQAFYVYYPNKLLVENCTFHSTYGQGTGTAAPTLQWGWFYQSPLVNFTQCNITIDIVDEAMTLETFFFYYACGDLNLLRTNVTWNVDAAGAVVNVIAFSEDSWSNSGLDTFSLKQSSLNAVVSRDATVSLLRITPEVSIGAFKVSASEVNLEYLVPTSVPVAAIQMSGSDMTISDLKLNLKAPASGIAEIVGLSIESGSPTLTNITVMGNGNGRITGILAMLASTPTLNGCLVDNCYIGIGGDFFGMPFISKSTTVNCTIGLGLNNLCNATVVDSVIKGRTAVRLVESSRVNMFTSTIQGSVLDWDLNGTSTAWLLDCTFRAAISDNFRDDGSRLIVNWYLSMWVTWQNNREIPGADIVMRNVQNEEFMRGTTDIQGVVAPFIVVEYQQTKNAKTLFSPYVVNVTSGGVSGEQSVTTDKSKVGLLREHIIIRDDLLPEVAILEPQAGAIQNFVTVTMLGTASDVGSGVDYLMVSYDGTKWAKVDAAAVWMEVLQVPEGTWTLTAKAFDKSGNEASATRQIVIDLTRPFINVASPPDKSLGNVIGVDLAGSVEPGSTLMVNFRPASVSAEGQFSYPVRLVEGRNDFLLFARDRAGNENTTSWTLYLDITPPPLTVLQPKDGLLTNQSTVMVTGKTEAGAAVTVNGVPAVVGADGAFSAQLGLTVGPNFITVVASDAAGNKNTVLRSVVMDNEVRLDISAPADKLVTTQVTILVMGSTDPDALVRLNGAVVSIESDGNFSVTFTLNEGWNTLVFAASDRAGNFRSVARTVLLDTIAPLVEVGTPQTGAMLRTGSVAVSGICEPGITLTVNGQPADTAAGVFNATVTLPEGANRIVVEGRDAAGNKHSIEVPITVDLTNPSLKIIEPSVGFRTVERSVLVVGLTEPGAKVTVNDMPAVVDAFGRFTVQLTLARGANQVTATSTDAAGNTATEKMTVKVVDRVASTGAGDWWWTALGLLLALGIMIPLTMYLVNSWQKARIEKGGSK
jgi:hypothetical protein